MHGHPSAVREPRWNDGPKIFRVALRDLVRKMQEALDVLR
jgi:hypothetical protein